MNFFEDFDRIFKGSRFQKAKGNWIIKQANEGKRAKVLLLTRKNEN